MRLRIAPLTLAQANAFIGQYHRHHKPAVGHRFSLGVFDEGRCAGVVIVGRPVARMVDQYAVAEVTRLATDGTRNACSILYAACARACDAMGFSRVQTYTLPEESGASLRAAGWDCEGETGGGDWNRPNLLDRQPNRTDQPMSVKLRWSKTLSNASHAAPPPAMLTENAAETGEDEPSQQAFDFVAPREG